MTHEDHVQSFNQGVRHGKSIVLNEMLCASDKIEFIKALYGKSDSLAKMSAHPTTRAKLEGYNAGVRACLQIIRSLGPAAEAYKNIINPDIVIEITEEDL